MTDVPPDNGDPGPAPAVPDPPVVHRSNFAPPPAGAEPPIFDDDALAEAMAAEVRPYTAPITLPRVPAMPPPAGAEFDAPPPVAAVPPAPSVFSAPAASAPAPSAVAWDGSPIGSAGASLPAAAAPAPPAPAPPAPAPIPPAPPAPAATPPAPAGPALAFPPAPAAAPEPAPAASAPADGGPGQDELLRALGGASTLEAIERLENELRLIRSGEQPTIDLTATLAAGAPVAAPRGPAAAEPQDPVGPQDSDPDDSHDAPAPALDHPAPGHFFPPPFAPIAVETANETAAETAAAEPATAGVADDGAWVLPTPGRAVPPAGIPGLLDVDESLIDPAAAAELRPASGSSFVPAEAAGAATPAEEPWWGVTAPVEGAWESAAPADPSSGPAFGVAVPVSTEPPVGPESPDWLDAPPPVYTPPELIEPPAYIDASPEAALDPVAPITANTMASLPVPLPTDQPNIDERAELPPPPGYEDIPILSSDVAVRPAPVAPEPFLPAASPSLAEPVAGEPASATASPFAIPPDADPFAALLAAAAPPAAPGWPPAAEATETAGLDHDDDDVIDAVDRVTGTGAIPISAAGTIEPLAPPSEPIATIRLSEDQPAMVDEKAQQPSAFEVEAAGLEPTARDLRAGRAARLFWLWFAANSSVLSLGLGAVLLGTGMSLRQAIVATLAGVAISFLPLGLGTLAGKWSGQPTMIVSRAAFGHAGNILPALLAVVTRVLWGGVLLWLLATAVAQVLVGAGLDAGLGTTVWQLVGLVAGFVIATVIAVYGYGFVAKLQLVLSIVSGLLILGSAALTYQHLDFSKALTIPDGSWILVISGAALVFSVVGLAWVHSSSDLARYQRPASYGGSSMLWATFGATLPPFLLIAWGAVLAASDPDIAAGLTGNPLAAIASLLPAWYPAPLLAAAALGLLSGAVLTMYSGAFALQAVGLRVRRSLGTVLSAILVLAAASALLFLVSDFGSLVRDLVITIAVPVAAWAGIFAAEMMIRTRRFHGTSLLAPGGIYPQLRVLNFFALIVISVIGLGLVSSSIPGLEWEGFLYGLAGIGPKDPWAGSEAGVFVALLLGILVPLIGGVPAIRRQERTKVVAG